MEPQKIKAFHGMWENPNCDACRTPVNDGFFYMSSRPNDEATAALASRGFKGRARDIVEVALCRICHDTLSEEVDALPPNGATGLLLRILGGSTKP